MRAREIENINSFGSVDTNLPVIFSVRVAELWDLSKCLDDPDDVRGLHDMRIAAKRIRYILEFFEDRFAESYLPLRRRFKQLQDLLGEVHDCDEWVEYLTTQLKKAHMEAYAEVEKLAEYGGASRRLRESVEVFAGELQTGPKYGLCMLLIDICERKQKLYDELISFWATLEQDDFRQQLLHAVAAASGAGDTEPCPTTTGPAED